jgi:hypothetical protein
VLEEKRKQGNHFSVNQITDVFDNIISTWPLKYHLLFIIGIMHHTYTIYRYTIWMLNIHISKYTLYMHVYHLLFKVYSLAYLDRYYSACIIYSLPTYIIARGAFVNLLKDTWQWCAIYLVVFLWAFKHTEWWPQINYLGALCWYSLSVFQPMLQNNNPITECLVS